MSAIVNLSGVERQVLIHITAGAIKSQYSNAKFNTDSNLPNCDFTYFARCKFVCNLKTTVTARSAIGKDLVVYEGKF